MLKSQKEKKIMVRGHFHPRPHSSIRFIHCHSFPYNNIFSYIMSISIHFHPFQPIFVYFHQFHPCSFTFIHFHPITFSSIHLQHKAYFLIQLNADSLYPFACWSLCLLCLLILMLIILIESRSMLIVYWLGDLKLINEYLTKNSMQNINLQKDFLKT